MALSAERVFAFVFAQLLFFAISGFLGWSSAIPLLSPRTAAFFACLLPDL
jgi:hypothetical protein